MRKKNGMATMMFVMTVLAVVTIITVFTARVITTDHKIFSNVKNDADALNAAQAGADYALGYLNRNMSAVLSTATPGGLDNCSSVSNTVCLGSGTLQACTSSPAGPTNALPNNATYTINYTCITAANTNTITISSVGVSADGSATRTIAETVKKYVVGSAIAYPPTTSLATGSVPLITSGPVSLSQSSNIISNPVNATIGLLAGGAVSFANSAYVTVTASGQTVNRTTPVGSYSPTVQQNISALAGTSDATLQSTYLGDQIPNFKSMADINVNPGGSATYTSTTSSSGTNTWAGKIVYLDMSAGQNNAATNNTATFNSSFYAGTAANPVLIVVNGNADIRGSGVNASTIFGSVYVMGTLTISQAATVSGLIYGNSLVIAGGSGTTTGGAAVAGSEGVAMSQSGTITLNSDVSFDSTRYRQFGVVAGSWRDF